MLPNNSKSAWESSSQVNRRRGKKMSATDVWYHPQILGGPSNILRMCSLPRGNCPRTRRSCKTPNRVRIFPPHMPPMRTPTSHNTRQYCCTQNSANSPPAACASLRSPWPTRVCAYRMRDREWSPRTAASRSRSQCLESSPSR